MMICQRTEQVLRRAERLPANLLVSDQALGSASKFFNLDAWEDVRLPFILSPKASRSEKEAGLQESDDNEKSGNNLASNLCPEPRKNPHPTVKPLKLMSYLITMGSREGDTVLDPFCGSGTTCAAAKLLKRRYLGIELNPEYHEIALKRVKAA